MVGFIAAFFVQLLVGVTLMVLAYVLMPKPKAAKPEASKDLAAPTAEAGRPIPVIFGTMTIQGTNVLWWGDKRKKDRMVKA